LRQLGANLIFYGDDFDVNYGLSKRAKQDGMQSPSSQL